MLGLVPGQRNWTLCHVQTFQKARALKQFGLLPVLRTGSDGEDDVEKITDLSGHCKQFYIFVNHTFGLSGK